MRINMTQAEIFAQRQKNYRNMREQQDALASAALSVSYGRGVPPTPAGWTDARWQAAVKTYIRSLEQGDTV